MNEPADRRSLPVSHQRLIAMMQSVTPPPDDGGTPPIPDELLRRLREQYGMSSQHAMQLQAIERDPAEVTASPPTDDTAALPPRRSGSFWGRLCPRTCPSQLALAASCLLLGLIVSIMLPQNREKLILGESRGIEHHTVAVTDYWLTSEHTPPPSGMGPPKFMSIQTEPEAPRCGTIIVFDPAHLEARMFRDGALAGSAKVTDAQESSEWITARRQLLRSVQP